MSELTKDILKSIENFSSNADKFLTSKDFNKEIFLKLVNEYDNITDNLITDKNTQDNILKYLTDNKTKIIDDKYKPLSKINDLNLKCYKFYKQKIRTLIKDKKYPKVIPLLTDAISLCSNNAELTTLIEKYLIKEKLDKDIIDIYKTLFMYSSNPVYFIKIGDICYKNKDYQEALDYYLNYAESGEQTVEIFTKLANVFGKINDNESRLTCLKEIKRIQANEL